MPASSNPPVWLHLPEDVAVRWVSYGPEAEQQLLPLLSDQEKDRRRGFTHAKRRREFTLGRAAARLLLAERLDVAPRAVPLHVAEDGAVDVLGSDLSVSIAHSGGHAVAAVGRRVVGVDLEVIAPRHPRLRRFLLHPDEEPDLKALPVDADRATMLYWTVKEASLKALRTGFRFSPKKVRVTVDYPERTAAIQVADGRMLRAEFQEHEGCYLALAFDPHPARTLP